MKARIPENPKWVVNNYAYLQNVQPMSGKTEIILDHGTSMWQQAVINAKHFKKVSTKDLRYFCNHFENPDEQCLSIAEKIFNPLVVDQYKKLMKNGITKLIQVNIPRNKKNFEQGIGEGCWVWVDDETYKIYKEDKDISGIYEGISDNTIVFYPHAPLFTTIKFVLRKRKRPVALIEELLQEYQSISDKQGLELMRLARTGTYSDEELADIMREELKQITS